MKTFRRYLLSYIGLLLIPVLILSAVVLNIVKNYCGQELIARNSLLLEQLSDTVSLELDQLDSYVLETSRQSNFYYRNQEKIGNIYSVQRDLSSWISACGFVNRIDYVNSKGGKYYTISSVNTLEDYYSLYIHDDSLTKERFQAAIEQKEGHRWVASYARQGKDGKLIYLTSVRVSSGERNTLICMMNTDLLSGMIDEILPYNQHITYICAEDGTVLYENDQNEENSPGAAMFLQAAGESGRIDADGIAYVYSRVDGSRGLTYISAVPAAVINRPLHALWRVFSYALVLTALLGIAGIYILMKLNWLPIKQLHDAVVGDSGAGTVDAVEAVHQAVLGLQEHTRRMNRANQLYAQDQLIFRLLLGEFVSVQAFNAAAESCHIRLSGQSWKLVVVQYGDNHECMENEYADLLQKALPNALLLELPEKYSVIVLLPADQEEDALPEAITRMDKDALASGVCYTVQDIVKAWQKLLHKMGQKNGQTFTVYESSSIKGLQDALNLGEAEQALFSFDMLLTESKGQDNLKPMAYDVLQLFQSKLIAMKHISEAEQVRQIGLSVMGLRDAEREHMLRLLQDAMSVVHRLLARQANPQEAMLQEINQFLAENFADPDLTVGKVADRFGISGSNLSHFYKSRTGTSVSDQLQEIRMTTAVSLLTGTKLSVAAIAMRCGYALPATFMRVFKRHMGVTPSEYRSHHACNDK